MKPSRFDYYAPQSLDEALALLEKFASDARLLAGGQSLVPLMNMRLASPQEIIDINKVAALDYIEEHDGYLCLGALTRHRTIERSPLVAAYCPLLSKPLPLLAILRCAAAAPSVAAWPMLIPPPNILRSWPHLMA